MLAWVTIYIAPKSTHESRHITAPEPVWNGFQRILDYEWLGSWTACMTGNTLPQTTGSFFWTGARTVKSYGITAGPVTLSEAYQNLPTTSQRFHEISGKHRKLVTMSKWYQSNECKNTHPKRLSKSADWAEVSQFTYVALNIVSPVASSFLATGSSLNCFWSWSRTGWALADTDDGARRLASTTGERSGSGSPGCNALHCKHYTSTKTCVIRTYDSYEYETVHIANDKAGFTGSNER